MLGDQKDQGGYKSVVSSSSSNTNFRSLRSKLQMLQQLVHNTSYMTVSPMPVFLLMKH